MSAEKDREPAHAQASIPAGAVFLSFASEDVAAAERIETALRNPGIEVWFDKSELRGGDVWDQKIRREIQDWVLFIPIVSQHTQERLEGYFRHEWKLAIERAHHMAEQRAFLVPVVIDSTSDGDAIVPDLIRAVQWTRLPGGETPTAFVERVKRLLSGKASTTIRAAASAKLGTVREQAPASAWSRRAMVLGAAVVIIGAVGYLGIELPWISKLAAPAAFAPPPHSVAMLPFVNMSGEQEYFSEGLTQEMLDSLSRINELQVAARTSSFSFQGEHPDISRVAHKMNVAAVLEGSVRRSGNTVRVTTQLINGVTGFHLWPTVMTEISATCSSYRRILRLRSRTH